MDLPFSFVPRLPASSSLSWPGAFGQFAGCDTGERYVDGPNAERRIDVENRRRALDYIAAEQRSVPALTTKKFWATFGADDDGLRANESFGAVEIMRPGVRSLWRVVTIGSYAVIMIGATVGFALLLAPQIAMLAGIGCIAVIDRVGASSWT